MAMTSSSTMNTSSPPPSTGTMTSRPTGSDSSLDSSTTLTNDEPPPGEGDRDHRDSPDDKTTAMDAIHLQPPTTPPSPHLQPTQSTLTRVWSRSSRSSSTRLSFIETHSSPVSTTTIPASSSHSSNNTFIPDRDRERSDNNNTYRHSLSQQCYPLIPNSASSSPRASSGPPGVPADVSGETDVDGFSLSYCSDHELEFEQRQEEQDSTARYSINGNAFPHESLLDSDSDQDSLPHEVLHSEPFAQTPSPPTTAGLGIGESPRHSLGGSTVDTTYRYKQRRESEVKSARSHKSLDGQAYRSKPNQQQQRDVSNERADHFRQAGANNDHGDDGPSSPRDEEFESLLANLRRFTEEQMAKAARNKGYSTRISSVSLATTTATRQADGVHHHHESLSRVASLTVKEERRGEARRKERRNRDKHYPRKDDQHTSVSHRPRTHEVEAPPLDHHLIRHTPRRSSSPRRDDQSQAGSTTTLAKRSPQHATPAPPPSQHSRHTSSHSRKHKSVDHHRQQGEPAISWHIKVNAWRTCGLDEEQDAIASPTEQHIEQQRQQPRQSPPHPNYVNFSIPLWNGGTNRAVHPRPAPIMHVDDEVHSHDDSQVALRDNNRHARIVNHERHARIVNHERHQLDDLGSAHSCPMHGAQDQPDIEPAHISRADRDDELRAHRESDQQRYWQHSHSPPQRRSFQHESPLQRRSFQAESPRQHRSPHHDSAFSQRQAQSPRMSAQQATRQPKPPPGQEYQSNHEETVDEDEWLVSHGRPPTDAPRTDTLAHRERTYRYSQSLMGDAPTAHRPRTASKVERPATRDGGSNSNSALQIDLHSESTTRPRHLHINTDVPRPSVEKAYRDMQTKMPQTVSPAQSPPAPTVAPSTASVLSQQQSDLSLPTKDIEILETRSPEEFNASAMERIQRRLLYLFPDLTYSSDKASIMRRRPSLRNNGPAANHRWAALAQVANGSTSQDHAAQRSLRSQPSVEGDLGGPGGGEVSLEVISRYETTTVNPTIYTEQRVGRWVVRGPAVSVPSFLVRATTPQVADPWKIPIDTKGIVERKKLKSTIEMASTRCSVKCTECGFQDCSPVQSSTTPVKSPLKWKRHGNHSKEDLSSGAIVPLQHCHLCSGHGAVEKVFVVVVTIRCATFLPIALSCTHVSGQRLATVEYADEDGRQASVQERIAEIVQNAARQVGAQHRADHSARLMMAKVSIERKGVLVVAVKSSGTGIKRYFEVVDGGGKITELKSDSGGSGGSNGSATTTTGRGYPRVEQAAPQPAPARKSNVVWQSQTPPRTASFPDRRASESIMGSTPKPSTPQIASPASGSSMISNTTSPRQVVFQLQASPKLGGQGPASAPARSTNHPMMMRQQALNYPPILAKPPPQPQATSPPVMRPIAMKPMTTMPRREEVAPWLAAVSAIASVSPTTSPRTAPAALPCFPPQVTERRSSRMVVSATTDENRQREQQIQRNPRSAAAAGRRKEEADLVKGFTGGGSSSGGGSNSAPNGARKSFTGVRSLLRRSAG